MRCGEDLVRRLDPACVVERLWVDRSDIGGGLCSLRRDMSEQTTVVWWIQFTSLLGHCEGVESVLSLAKRRMDSMLRTKLLGVVLMRPSPEVGEVVRNALMAFPLTVSDCAAGKSPILEVGFSRWCRVTLVGRQ